MNPNETQSSSAAPGASEPANHTHESLEQSVHSNQLSSSQPIWDILKAESARDLNDWVIGRNPSNETGGNGTEEEAGSGELVADTPFRYSQEALDKPILKCMADKYVATKQLSRLLLSWEESYGEEKEGQKPDIIDEIKITIDRGGAWHDEFCLQIFKQISGNPNPLPYWELLERTIKCLGLSENVARVCRSCCDEILGSNDSSGIVRRSANQIKDILVQRPPWSSENETNRPVPLERRQSESKHSLIGSPSTSLMPIGESNPLYTYDSHYSDTFAALSKSLPGPSAFAHGSTGAPINPSGNGRNSDVQMNKKSIPCSCFGSCFQKRLRRKGQPTTGGDESMVSNETDKASMSGAISSQLNHFRENGPDRQVSQPQQLYSFEPGAFLHGKYTIQSIDQKERILYAESKCDPKEVVLKLYTTKEEGERTQAFHESYAKEYFSKLHDFFEVDSEKYKYCIVYERGTETLTEWMRNGPDDPDKSAVMKRVGMAVQYLHSEGYAHRDLKPENIMKFGDVWKLIDFDSVSRIGEVSSIAYTLRYAAPEVVRAVVKGERTITVKAEHDMWSLGIISFEVFSQGKRFYTDRQDGTLKTFISGQLNASYIEERVGLLESNRRKQSVVEKCLKLNPEERIDSEGYTKRAFFRHATDDTTMRLDREKQEEELKYLRTRAVQGNVKIRATIKAMSYTAATASENPDDLDEDPNLEDIETRIFELQEAECYQLTVKLTPKSNDEVVLFDGVSGLEVKTANGEIELPNRFEARVGATECTIKAVIPRERINADLRSREVLLNLVIDLKVEVKKGEDSIEAAKHKCKVKSALRCVLERPSLTSRLLGSLSRSTAF